MTVRKVAGRMVLAVLGTALLAFLFLPLLSVFFSMSPATLFAKLHTPITDQALLLSLQTTLVSILFILLFGTPLAYWLAKSNRRGKKALEVALQLPIVTPPAVAGVGLLLVFGQMGWFGPLLNGFHLQITFNTTAVVLAQIFISAPFYLSSAKQAFDAVDDQLIDVSRTLGVPPLRTFWRITVPLALPGLLSGLALSWARSLGEFGATMMFAGNLPGKTQTLPLAIYTAMQDDLQVAVAISAMLLFVAFVLLLLVGLIDRQVRQARNNH